MVYLLVGWRLGLPLQGVNLPGQFLVKWQSPNAQFFIDPFNEGQMLDAEDCRSLCERLGQRFTSAALASANPRQILLRICRNLQAIHSETEPDRADQLGRFVALLSAA